MEFILFFVQNSQSTEHLRENDVQIIGVNVESQMQMLEELDLYSLAMTAKSNRSLAPIADDVFRRKFASKTVGIFGPLSTDPRYSVHILDTIITNYNFDVFTLILQTFGHFIEKLDIGYNGIQQDQRKQIHQLINKHCSRTLKAIELMEWDENVLDSMENPFQNVHHLTLAGNLKTKSSSIFNILSVFGGNSMNLNEIFPNLHSLTLDALWVSDPNILNIKFSQLNQVEIKLLAPPFNHPLDNYFAKSKPAMEKLFRNNPQIRNVTIEQCNSLDYLRIVVDHLPNLEVFQVIFGRMEEKYNGNPIHFEKLKDLNLKFGNSDLSNIVSFGQLENLVLECNVADCNEFPFNTIESLKKLFIVGFSFNDEQLLQLAERVPFLEDLFMVNDSDIDAGSIIKFAVGSKQLRKLTLINPFGGTLSTSIRRHLKDEWTVKRNNMVFTLERQNTSGF